MFLILDETQSVFSVEAANRYIYQYSNTHTTECLFEVMNTTTAKLAGKQILEKVEGNPQHAEIRKKILETVELFKSA